MSLPARALTAPASSGASKVVHVGIGRASTGRDQVVLQANLGSCLGVAIGWPDRGIYALAHVLLPAHTNGDTRYARYADTAVRHLLRLLKVKPGEVRQLSAVIAGGAAMYSETGRVGEKNVAHGKAALREARVRLIGQDVGGETGRRISVSCTDGVVRSMHLSEDESKGEQWTIRARVRR